MQEVTIPTKPFPFHPSLFSPITCFFHFQGLNLLELATHLEQKATQLKCEGLGHIEIALAGTDTFSLIEIVQAHFGHVKPSESEQEEDVFVEEEKASGTSKEVTAKSKEVGKLATAELVLPFQSIPLVIVGIPTNYLPLCDLKSHSCYHSQVPPCNPDFAQEAATCNHVWHDHLNVALTWLYCSFEDNPKMHWLSTIAWEHHTMKHLKDNLPFSQMILLFLRNSYYKLVVMLLLAHPNKFYLMKKLETRHSH